ncbi:MAG: carotenoid 1,2-hydratase [Chromatiales bacterium]|jgi:predicted secreted hydrolase|nr:carotenoid 1,2-hydratase [Chromatiales bacterium]
MSNAGRSLVVVAAIAAALWWALASQQEERRAGDPVRVSSVLGEGDTAGFELADPGYRLVFPADHGPHPDFRTEWWYFTGNLMADDGRHFGFQYTIFRFALAAEGADRASPWATRQIWMGHLALTDVTGERFYRVERFARGGSIGLAGATSEPFRVWLDDWAMQSQQDSFLPLQLSAQDADFGIELLLTEGVGPVLQGEQGYSAKGPGTGNASHYYSFTRLDTLGRIRIGAEDIKVAGQAWLDREWSTSALGPDVNGWDWFALQMSDGSDLMFYRLRRADGRSDPLSAGLIVGPGGSARRLASVDARVRPTRYWTSDETGIRYPVAWQLELPGEALDLQVEALLDAQEMALSVRYWEGAVGITGSRDGRAIEGFGYLEMTGYEED